MNINERFVVNGSYEKSFNNSIIISGGSGISTSYGTIININPYNFLNYNKICKINNDILGRISDFELTKNNEIISITEGINQNGKYPILTKSNLEKPFYCNTQPSSINFPKQEPIYAIPDNSYALSNSNINIRVEDYMPEITVTPLSFRLRTICTNEEPFSGIGVNIGKDSVVICNDTSYTITTTNPSQNSKFYWNTGDTTRKITVKKTGVYKLRTVKGQCENIDSLKVIFANVKLPHFTNDSTLCIGQSVIIDATKGQLYNPIYKWNDNSNIGKRTITKKGNYTLSIKNSYSCKDTFRIKINYHDSLKAEIMKDTLICKGAQAKLHIDISGGIELKQTAQWFDDMNNLIGTGKIVFKNFINSTKVKAVVTDSCTSYQITKYVNINVRPPLKISYLRDTAICLGQSVELFTDGSGGDSSAYNFEWNNNLGTGKSKIVIPSKTTKYIVVLKDNCTFKFDTAECIISIPTVRAIAKANPMITTIEIPFVVFENLSTPSVLNEWNWGDGSSTITATREKIEITYGDTGVYVVSLKIKSPYGCFDDTTLKIRIKDIFRFYVPNAFTPDGNSLNECFEFKTRGVKKFKFIVYNSWGEKIFESTNPLDGWSGNELPMGIYFYTAEVYDQDFILHNYKGIIHLIR